MSQDSPERAYWQRGQAVVGCRGRPSPARLIERPYSGSEPQGVARRNFSRVHDTGSEQRPDPFAPRPLDPRRRRRKSARHRSGRVGRHRLAVTPADPHAAWFAAHVQPHEARLRGWLRSQFPRANDVDDLVQEAFVRVLAAHARGEIRAPRAFLFATARTRALARLRHQRVEADFA